MFPGVEFKDIEYETLRSALNEVCAECHLGVIDSQVHCQITIVTVVYSGKCRSSHIACIMFDRCALLLHHLLLLVTTAYV